VEVPEQLQINKVSVPEALEESIRRRKQARVT